MLGMPSAEGEDAGKWFIRSTTGVLTIKQRRAKMNGGRGLITLNSDLRLSFEEMNIRFMSILDDKRDELTGILRMAMDEFDFTKAFEEHVQAKIHEGLDKAFDEIDISARLKVLIWNELERRLGLEKRRNSNGKRQTFQHATLRWQRQHVALLGY